MSTPQTKARLYAVIARGARKAAVFRRGPSKSVLLLSWDLATDTLETGQWLKGRIYERRCDISPDGQLLVYFAASYRGPWQTWTAISRPPYLTALAAWPKGDAWGGGGLFRDNNVLELNHPHGEERDVASGFSLPNGFQVEPLGPYSGGGEDDPIASIRAHRDGWTMVSVGKASEYSRKGPFHWRVDPPTIFERALDRRRGVILRTKLLGIGARDGSWYAQTGHLVDAAGSLLVELGRIDWADVDHNGDVLFARDGCLFRLPRRTIKQGREPDPLLVADLNDLAFEPIVSPHHARSWPKLRRARKVR